VSSFLTAPQHILGYLVRVFNVVGANTTSAYTSELAVRPFAFEEILLEHSDIFREDAVHRATCQSFVRRPAQNARNVKIRMQDCRQCWLSDKQNCSVPEPLAPIPL